MAEIKMGDVWRVDIMEYERGWGSRLDETKYFDNKPEADAFVKKFNSRNIQPTAPDWYMVAQGPYKV